MRGSALSQQPLPWKDIEELSRIAAFKKQPEMQLQEAWNLPTLDDTHELLKNFKKQNFYFHKIIVNPCLDVEYCSKNSERNRSLEEGDKWSKASINEYFKTQD